MKRVVCAVLAGLMLLGLCACGGTDARWQEQYDLGIKYLEDGSYEEAVLAFTAAIEIDPKQAPAYVGRGGAYIGSGETEENLAAAQADYEEAIALDGTSAAAYLGLADVYIRRGEYDQALELLREALEKTENDQSIADKLAEMEGGTISDSSGKTRRVNNYQNGELVRYSLHEYDEEGRPIKTSVYQADGTLDHVRQPEYDEQGQAVSAVITYMNGPARTERFHYEFGADGRRMKETRELAFLETGRKDLTYTLFSYDDAARAETQDHYTEDGRLIHHTVIESDAEGKKRKINLYRPDEAGNLYLDNYTEYIWNEDGTLNGLNQIQVAPKEER